MVLSPYTLKPRSVNQCDNEFSGEEPSGTLMQLETASDSDSSPSSTESTDQLKLAITSRFGFNGTATSGQVSISAVLFAEFI